MTGFATEITVDDTLVPGIGRLQQAALDLAVPMLEAAGEMLFSTRERFSEERGPNGVPWKKSRRVIEEGGKTLFQSGDLFNAIDKRSGPDFAEVGIAGGSGGPPIYGPVHQRGATIRPRRARALKTPAGPRASVTIPARPFLGFSAEDRDTIGDIFRDHLRKAIGGAA